MPNINALKTESINMIVTVDELINSLEREILLALYIPKDSYINPEGKIVYLRQFGNWEEEITVRVPTEEDKAVLAAFQTIRKIAKEKSLV